MIEIQLITNYKATNQEFMQLVILIKTDLINAKWWGNVYGC